MSTMEFYLMKQVRQCCVKDDSRVGNLPRYW